MNTGNETLEDQGLTILPNHNCRLRNFRLPKVALLRVQGRADEYEDIHDCDRNSFERFGTSVRAIHCKGPETLHIQFL